MFAMSLARVRFSPPHVFRGLKVAVVMHELCAHEDQTNVDGDCLLRAMS